MPRRGCHSHPRCPESIGKHCRADNAQVPKRDTPDLYSLLTRYSRYALNLISTAQVIARKRKSAEVGVEDIAKCYGYFLDEKRSTQWLAEQQGSLVFDALADGDVAMATA
jgi:RuvB-like protein 2